MPRSVPDPGPRRRLRSPVTRHEATGTPSRQTAPGVGLGLSSSDGAFPRPGRARCVLLRGDGRSPVGGELARPQPSGFYGGGVTSDVVGPFFGGTGILGVVMHSGGREG